MKTVPPGFPHGHNFDRPKASLKTGSIKEIKIGSKTQPTSTKAPADEVVDGLVEGVDSIRIDEQTGFTFIRHKKKEEDGSSWARAVDANHVPGDFNDVVPKLAFEYGFELDPFQKQAVYHLERNESVFVAAHTSAGKTVVAEYAIALAHKHLTKAIYTSPIKALSNQKFRDFRQTFGESEVGLLTGDIQLNAEAPCLIMTTEILRSMLYRGADTIADVEFVIFDEVHYVNDAERGVVWEEVIIMLPPHVTLIMLSATIPNTLEFADWVGRTKQKPIYVVSTLKRPVPLEHFLYVRGGEPLKIVDASRNFIEAGYRQAVTLVKPTTTGPKAGAGALRGVKQERSLWLDVTYMLRKKSLLPAVVFTFSKRKCEENADGLTGVDLLSLGEKSAVHVFLETSFQRLRGTDAQLPQILRMREMLSRGVAVHHSGLLPLVKEAVEILFGRGLVRVLFATETFAMGVNMPARTVVFASLRKHDGTGFRTLLPGEYTQMAGRAGRRGLDPTGVVMIACPEEVPAETTLRTTILGTPTRLTSRFRLTYRMILSLMRVQALCMEDVMRQSFSEDAAQRALPAGQAEVEAASDALKALPALDCVVCGKDIQDYYAAAQGAIDSGTVVHDWLLHESRQAARCLEAGRLVIINAAFYRNAPAVVLRLVDNGKGSRGILVLTMQQSEGEKEDALLPPDILADTRLDSSGYELLTIGAAELLRVTKEKLKLPFEMPAAGPAHPSDLQALQRQLAEYLRQASTNVKHPLLSELDLPASKRLDVDEQRLLRKARLESLAGFQAACCPDLPAHYRLHHQHQQLRERLAELQFRMSDASMLLLPEYHARVHVLKSLGYIDPHSGLVLLKGRVAAEINTTDELITTELLFSNLFAEYEPAEIIALLSAMVFQERHAAEPKLEGRLLAGREKMLETAKDLVTTQRQHGVDIAMDQVIAGLNFALVQVVYEWASGRPFKQITELTDVLEGSIVRCIVRLDETCRELRGAAKIMGDPSLHRKMEEASVMIKRDICFAASLYY